MRLQSASSKQARHLFHASIDAVAGSCAVAMSPQNSCAHDANAVFALNVFAGTGHPNYRGSAFKPVIHMPGDLRSVAGQARRVPKVPSMLFELEVRTVRGVRIKLVRAWNCSARNLVCQHRSIMVNPATNCQCNHPYEPGSARTLCLDSASNGRTCSNCRDGVCLSAELISHT